jgi:hypothetical protein
MGYRSDLVIAHSFTRRSHALEVLTAFTLDQRCAEYDLTKYLSLGHERIPSKDGKRDVHTLVFVGEQWKWYEQTLSASEYADVKCINSMLDLCKSFNEERGIPYAYKFIRIGEEDGDVEVREEKSDCESGEFLEDYQNDSAYIQTTIENDFRNLKPVSDAQNVSDALTESIEENI